jgi:DNA polymerase-3 subunit gamma/tau
MLNKRYEPLHLKYRPKRLDDLIGQPIVSRALRNAIGGRIPNAFLFSGIRGTGKTTAARIVAASLNCSQTDAPTVTPCGECLNCRGIWNGSSLDVMEIDAAAHNGVDDIRELIQNCQLSTISGRFRVVILDECQQLSKQSQNAFLKTLEAPPASVVFVLATTEPNKLLDTIISRCIHLRFKRIRTEDLSDRLAYIAAQENLTVSRDAVTLLAQSCDGSLREALQLLDQLAGEDITVEGIRTALGLPAAELMLKIVNAIMTPIYSECIALVKQGLEVSTPEQLLNQLTLIFRDLYLLSLDQNANDLRSGLDVKDLIPVADGLDPETVEILLNILRQKSALTLPNPEVWLEIVLLDLARTMGF